MCLVKRYKLIFSNCNNVWYDTDSFYGTEIEMLKYANEKLNNKLNKLYNLWIYEPALIGCFHRGKKLEKLINYKTNLTR